MLIDPSSPFAQRLFHVAGIHGRLLKRGQQMSVASSRVRFGLLAECLPMFEELRELARTQFVERAPFILKIVDEYQAAIRELATLGGGKIAVDRRSGKGNCPACSTPISKFKDIDIKGFNHWNWIIVCMQCHSRSLEASIRLESEECFGLDAI